MGFKIGRENTGVFENYYWKLAHEIGLIGFVLFLTIILYTLLINLISIKYSYNKENRAISGFALSYLIYVLITCVTGWSIDIEPTQVYFWLIIGISVRLAADKRRPVLENH